MSASYLWRRVLFRTHWIAGLLAGLVLSAVGVTGAVLAFEDEILVALNPQLAIVPEGEPRSPDALIAAVRERHPDRGIAGFAWRGATRAADVRFDGGFDAGSVAIDPYRGTLLPAARGADAIHAIEQVHRNLAAGPVGKQLVGASTVVLVLLAITGIWLRWPKRWTSPRAWLALDWSLRGRAFLWHLHSVVATWVLPFYVVAGITELYFLNSLTGLIELAGTILYLVFVFKMSNELKGITQNQGYTAWLALIWVYGPCLLFRPEMERAKQARGIQKPARGFVGYFLFPIWAMASSMPRF